MNLHSIYQFPESQIIALALIFIRLLSFFFAMPVIGSSQIPISIKILFSLVLTVTLFPLNKLQNLTTEMINNQLAFLCLRELGIGLFLGFLVRMIFFTVSISGELIGVSSGLSSAQLFNPSLGSTGNVYEQFQVYLATILFISLNGHHLFIFGIAKSFELLPISDIAINTVAFLKIPKLVPQVFLVGVQIAAPILVSIFIANITMGILGRAVPQLHVFMTSLPITIMIGFGVMFLIIPFYLNELQSIIEWMNTIFFDTLKVL